MKHIEETNCHLLHSVWWIFWHDDQFAQDKKEQKLHCEESQRPLAGQLHKCHRSLWLFWGTSHEDDPSEWLWIFLQWFFLLFLQKTGLKAIRKDRQADSLEAGLLQGLINSAITQSAKSHCWTKSVEIDTHIPTAFLEGKIYILQHDCGQQVSRRWDICGWHTSLTAIRSALIIIICSIELWIALIQSSFPA